MQGCNRTLSRTHENIGTVSTCGFKRALLVPVSDVMFSHLKCKVESEHVGL